jgi:hypothetical protein
MSDKIAEIVNRLPEADRVLVAEKLVELDRKLEQVRKFDTAVVDALVRVLKSPDPQAQNLRRLIREISNG